MHKVYAKIWILCLLSVLFCFTAGPVLAADPSRAPAGEPDYYTIGKGDVLRIVVWKEEELSMEVKVRVDGRISMPLVDDVLAAGKTPLQLKAVITKKMSEFIEGPEVTVIVQNQVSQAYYVLGETSSNGEYPLDKEVTVLQALARAGGFTDWADQKNLLLLRRNAQGKEERIHINYRDIVSGKSQEQNILLQAGDTLVVPY